MATTPQSSGATSTVSTATSSGWQQRLQALGPGILLATAAVGGSHIVASTQAGALFGWELLWLIVAVNVLKYPFFRFGVEYTLKRGENLLQGYQRRGPWFLRAFFGLNLIAAVVNTAAVLLLTASLLRFFTPNDWPLPWLCAGLLLLCCLMLLAGQYRVLDRLSKIIMLALTVTTVTALVIAIGNGPVAAADYQGPSPWQLASLGFLVALMGWMPAPIEISAINSLWLEQKQRQQPVSLAHGLFDLNVGYWSTTVLAVVFLALGALVQFGAGATIELAGAAYADQFVRMYAHTIGAWSTWLVALIAFLCMFGTTITVLDGYARTNTVSLQLLRAANTAEHLPASPMASLTAPSSASDPISAAEQQRQYAIWLMAQAVFGLGIVLFFKAALGPMLMFAMSLAFVTTPVFAWQNFQLMRHEGGGLSRGMTWLSWIGLLYLTGFALLFVLWWCLWRG